MKIKLKDKDKLISLSSGWCFMNKGFDLAIISDINSGKEVVVDKIPKPAKDLVEEVKKQNKKKEGK